MPSAPPPPFADLLAATAAGNRAAFARLYAATGGKLFSVALRILKRRDWAEDAVQEAFVSVWQNAGSYAPERGSPMTWMASIVRNRAIDRLRRDRGDVALDDAPGVEAWADSAPDPEASAAFGDDARRLGRCLDGLDAPQREAILLAYWHGLTQEELALRLDAPLGTIKSRIRRGLMRLKDCLDP